MIVKKYQNFAEFYPFYLSQHQDNNCRRMHFAGSVAILLLIAYVLFSSIYWLLVSIPIIGYGCAWLGHWIFEKNKPATFTYPLYSLLGDWVMFKDILIGKIKI